MDDHCRRDCKKVGCTVKKKKLWKKRKRRENFGHWFYCHFGTYLEHFLEFILYILYTVSKHRKLEVQHFKQCPNQSGNKKVMVIARKLGRAERKFRTLWIKVRNNLQKFFLQRNNFQKWGNLWNNFRKGESTCKNPSKLQKSKIQIRMATVPGAKWFRTVRTTPLPWLLLKKCSLIVCNKLF